MSNSDLVSFLTARLDEDERSATPGRNDLDELRFDLKRGDPYEQHLSSRIEDGLDAQTCAWEARVLREVAAKRAILTDWQLAGDDSADGLGIAVHDLACVWSDHPDYDPAWQ